MNDLLTSKSSGLVNLFFTMAEARGYDPKTLSVATLENRLEALAFELHFTRGKKHVELKVPLTVFRNEYRGSVTLMKWIYNAFERDVFPMLARSPSPRFRIATRGARRLQFDARTL